MQSARAIMPAAAVQQTVLCQTDALIVSPSIYELAGAAVLTICKNLVVVL
jgi:hypothetical protein